MIEETPSPARAGRLLSSACSSAVGSASTQSWPELKRPGKSLQQEERLGQHVIARHRLKLGDVERRQDVAQRQHAGRAVGAAGAGRRHDGVAGVEQHGAAVLHVGVDAGERRGRGLRRARHDRPVDQRKERKLVAGDVEADRLAGLERGALGEEQREALQAGLADAVDLGVAGDDVGEPRLDRGLHGEVEIGRRVRRGRRSACAGALGAAAGRCPARRPASRTSAPRSRPRARALQPRAAGACAGSAPIPPASRTPPARRARAAPAPPATPARADPAARRA